MSIKKRKATYIGRRALKDGVYHAFLCNKKEVYFKKGFGLTIGYKYELGVEGKNFTLTRFPDHLGERTDSEQTLNEWETFDAAAQELERARKAELKIRNGKYYLQYLKPLKPYVSKMSFREKKAFAEFIIDFLED